MISITDTLKSEDLKKKLTWMGVGMNNNPKEDYLDVRGGADRIAAIISFTEIRDADVGVYVN